MPGLLSFSCLSRLYLNTASPDCSHDLASLRGWLLNPFLFSLPLLISWNQCLATPDVKILDPCVGTGNFIVNSIKYIAATSRSALRDKYAHDLFCNEVALLPYYIASMNIEHEYYEKMGEYAPFEGICFVDTLELAEDRQLPLWVVEENTERIKREKEADIMVVIGNPPYNAWQKSENDNNKNRPYPIIDQRIRETYAKASKAYLAKTSSTHFCSQRWPMRQAVRSSLFG
jgi:predicted helicase